MPKQLTPKSSPEAIDDKSGRLQAVAMAMQQIEKDYGKGSIMKMGGSMKNLGSIPIIPSGSLSLDLA